MIKKFFIFGLMIFLCGCSLSENNTGGVVFSWTEEAVRDDYTLLFETVKVNDANEVYQCFDDEMSSEEIENFVSKAKKL